MNATWKRRMCTACVHCELEHIVSNEFALFCGNPDTKTIPRPIGFLDPLAPACRFFQPKEGSEDPPSRLHWVDVVAICALIGGFLVCLLFKAFILAAFLAALIALLVTLARSRKTAFKADAKNGKIEYKGEQ